MGIEELIGWNFPDNNYGQVVGISDAGIETFNGSLNASLTREICQNSIDAKDNSINKPVMIEFNVEKLLNEEVPGFEQLFGTMEKCLCFWKELGNEKTYHFFENAIKCLQNKYVNVMVISDYNTTGLVGSEKELNTPWHNLVKGNGISDKNETSGGSFGIGKSAPFACSKLRTVFYRTLDINGIKATQGISRLVSHRLENGKIASGTGYYGNINQNQAIEEVDVFEKIKVRTSSGTDIFIVGYDNLDNWEEQIICELLDGFLLPILNGGLVVKVGEIFSDLMGALNKKEAQYEYFKNKKCFLATIKVNISELIFDGSKPDLILQEKTEQLLRYIIGYVYYKILSDDGYMSNPIIRLPDNKCVPHDEILSIREIFDYKEIFDC